MAAITTLTIDKLEVQYSLDGLTDVVIQVMATLSGNDTGTTLYFTNVFDIAGPEPSSFVAFEDLTEEDCANFVTSTDRYTTLLQYLTAEIEQKKKPPTKGQLPLPWDSKEEAVEEAVTSEDTEEAEEEVTEEEAEDTEDTEDTEEEVEEEVTEEVEEEEVEEDTEETEDSEDTEEEVEEDTTS